MIRGNQFVIFPGIALYYASGDPERESDSDSDSDSSDSDFCKYKACVQMHKNSQ